MSGFDALLLIACLVAPVGLAIVVTVGAVWFRRRTHRGGMERFRAACRAVGLTQGTQFWEGTVGGVRVGACWVRYRSRMVPSAIYHQYTSYRAWIEPPMSIDLDVFGRARGEPRQGYTAFIEPWRRRPRPPRVELGPDPFGGKLLIHAADATAARAGFARPDLVAALREAMALCSDLRITDREVELLDDPYQADPAELDRRLRLAARIAQSLVPQRAA